MPLDTDLGDLGGISWRLRCHPASPGLVELDIADTGLRITIERADLHKIDPARLAQRLENAVHKPPTTRDDTRRELAALASEATAAQQRLTTTFPETDELTRLEAELEALNAELAADDPDNASPIRRAAIARAEP